MGPERPARPRDPRLLEAAAVLAAAGVPVASVLAAAGVPVAAVLAAAGVPVDAVADFAAFLAGPVDLIARRYVELIDEHVLPDPDAPLTDADIRRLSGIVRRLRPLAPRVVAAELSVAMERRIEAELGERMARLMPGVGPG
jgi:hypothetical protein